MRMLDQMSDWVDVVKQPPFNSYGYSIFEIQHSPSYPIYAYRFNSVRSMIAHMGRFMAHYDLQKKTVPRYADQTAMLESITRYLAQQSRTTPSEFDLEDTGLQGLHYNVRQVVDAYNDYEAARRR